ncbi:hypothetical protein CHUAL_012401 [Chamberlinius hualienensis]
MAWVLPIVLLSCLCLTTIVNCFCPAHMTEIYGNDDTELQACQPLVCICLNQNLTDVDVCHSDIPTNQELCPESYSNFVEIVLNEKCHWVKLSQYTDFEFNLVSGEIEEFQTRKKYTLGEYVYNPVDKEVYICRENLLPSDKTDDIMLWCSVLNYNTTEKPTIVNGKLVVPNLNHSISSKYYEYSDDPDYEVSVCVNTSVDFLRYEHKAFLNISDFKFEIESNWSLTVHWNEKSEKQNYHLGSYYKSVDDRFSVVTYQPLKTQTSE